MKYNDLIPELMVSNIDVSREFYVDILGFKVEYERKEDKFIFLSLGGIQLMLEEGTEEALNSMKYPFGKGINFSFGVDNVDEIYSRFLEKSYKIKSKLRTRKFRVNEEYLTVREFSVLDPDGYFIRVTD
ncbi:MAG: bleomycin resistance family protein [Clostridiales bacterium]|nr:MAG: bleomycin resistance family protein [Clostridiales bacterium]